MFGDAARTDRGVRPAEHVVAMDFHVGRVTGVPLEPRAALATYENDRYTLWAGSGGAVRQRRELAAVLGIAADKLRVISCDVGGNFGTRNRLYVEFGLVLWAARKIGRPVKFNATRSEAFVSDYQGRDLVTRRAGARCARPLPGDARDQYQQCGRALRVAVAVEQRRRTDLRLLRRPGRNVARRGGVHQHDADAGLSQFGPAGSDLCDRRLIDQAATRARHRQDQTAAQEFGAAEGDAVPQRGRHGL